MPKPSSPANRSKPTKKALPPEDGRAEVTERFDRRIDQRLVERCIQGEVAAWEEIYARCHEPLCASIRARLGRLAADPHLVDELAARVWYATVANDGELLTKYDPLRGGSILTFLRAIARDEMSRYFRSEKRRLRRELVSMQGRNVRGLTTYGEAVGNSVFEFLETLTPREKGFCGDYLLASAGEQESLPAEDYSRSNIWQLTHRVYRKMVRFLGR